MLLKRRKPAGLWEQFRIWIWPRRSWMRSGQYVAKRILRLTASPHAVAAGVAAGVLTSFSPFLGFHFATAFLFAWLVRGNMIAAALGTFVGNPLTFPFIWLATYNVGHQVLGTTPVATADEPPGIVEAMGEVVSAIWTWDGGLVLQAIHDIWTPLLYPMTVGAMLIGPLFAIPAYLLTRRAALLFREARRDRLMKKAAQLRDRAKALRLKKRTAHTGGAVPS